MLTILQIVDYLYAKSVFYYSLRVAQTEMPFFSVVSLKYLDRNIAISSKWCEGLNTARTKKYGVRPTATRKIFYSPLHKTPPDFTLDVRREFRADITACYEGRVLKTFSK